MRLKVRVFKQIDGPVVGEGELTDECPQYGPKMPLLVLNGQFCRPEDLPLGTWLGPVWDLRWPLTTKDVEKCIDFDENCRAAGWHFTTPKRDEQA
jgi:hypothetical protein